jgi:integral membrane protein
MLTTPLGRLRAIGMLEGISFLVLLGIAMPLKYLAGMPLAVRIVGMVHGGLFVLYVAAVAHVMFARRWPIDRAMTAVLAAVFPFGPFLLDRSLRREEEAAAREAVASPDAAAA